MKKLFFGLVELFRYEKRNRKIQNRKGIITIPEEERPKFFEMLIQYYETNNMNSIKKFVYDVCVQGIKEPPVEGETIDKSIFYKKQYRPKKRYR